MAKKILKEENIFIPMVTTLHGTDITLVGNHPFYKPAVTFSINNSDVVTSVSQSLKEDTLRLFDIRKEIHVVPNFISVPTKIARYRDCQRELMASEEERIVTHVSNLREVKRVRDVIEIFDRIRKKIPARLIIVGEGPERQACEALCEEKGIVDKVVFVGNSNEVDKILCFTDLFLLPSEKESFGLAALEAMASGVPVISSNTGGLPEVNIHGESGFLSDVGNVEEMAENALKILSDDETLNRFKIQAIESARRFDVKKIVPLYEALYKEAIENKNAAALK